MLCHLQEESMEAIMADPGKKLLWAAENGNTELVREILEGVTQLQGDTAANKGTNYCMYKSTFFKMAC